MAELKTYVLLKHTESPANVFIQVNQDQRVRMGKRIIDHAYMKMTFFYKGVNRTLRLKLGCEELDFHKQIKEYSIPANEGFTPAEKRAVEFRNGVLQTRNATVQKYLESIPLYDKLWEGEEKFEPTDELLHPMYTLWQKGIEIKMRNSQFQKRLAAGNLVNDADLEKAQELLHRAYGGFYKAPDDLEECQDQLVDFIDNSSDEGIDMLLKTDLTLEDEIGLMVAKAIQKGIISFDEKPDQVTLKRNKNTIPIFEVPSDNLQEERLRQFIEHLRSDEGKKLRVELQQAVKGKE